MENAQENHDLCLEHKKSFIFLFICCLWDWEYDESSLSSFSVLTLEDEYVNLPGTY